MPTTTTLPPGSSVISAEHIVIAIKLTVVVDIKFDNKLKDQSSALYHSYSKAFHDMIYKKYNDSDGFQGVTIVGFSNGSVECNYKLRFAAGIYITVITESIENNEWTNETLSLRGYGSVNISLDKTEAFLRKDLDRAENSSRCDLQENCNKYQSCEESNDGLLCKSKCSSDVCGEYGQCLLHPLGNTRCKCFPDSVFEHYSDKCLKSSDVTNILAVTASVVGAVIIVVVVCVCKKRRTKKKSHSSTRHKRVYGSEISMPTRARNWRANRAYNIEDRIDRGPARQEHMARSSENEHPAAYYNGWESIRDQPPVPPRMYLPMALWDNSDDYYTQAAHEQRRPQYVEPGDAYRSLDTENQLYIRRPRLSTRRSDMFGYRERFV